MHVFSPSGVPSLRVTKLRRRQVGCIGGGRRTGPDAPHGAHVVDDVLVVLLGVVLGVFLGLLRRKVLLVFKARWWVMVGLQVLLNGVEASRSCLLLHLHLQGVGGLHLRGCRVEVPERFDAGVPGGADEGGWDDKHVIAQRVQHVPGGQLGLQQVMWVDEQPGGVPARSHVGDAVGDCLVVPEEVPVHGVPGQDGVVPLQQYLHSPLD